MRRGRQLVLAVDGGRAGERGRGAALRAGVGAAGGLVVQGQRGQRGVQLLGGRHLEERAGITHGRSQALAALTSTPTVAQACG